MKRDKKEEIIWIITLILWMLLIIGIAYVLFAIFDN